jgi:hypothetical protein
LALFSTLFSFSLDTIFKRRKVNKVDVCFIKEEAKKKETERIQLCVMRGISPDKIYIKYVWMHIQNGISRNGRRAKRHKK